MEAKAKEYLNRGMRRSLSHSKETNEFAFENYNIRITALGENTNLSVTNEKGNKIITLLDSPKIIGTVLGHCIINNYLVLFTHNNEDGFDYIFRINVTNNSWYNRLIYRGSLNFDLEHPIETLVSYETEDIQKVYWVDGTNQPRLINVSDIGIEAIHESDDKQFDFVPAFSPEFDVEITKQYDGTGQFASGTIQYAFSYYSKFGAETNLFYITPIQYISMMDRGGKPDEIVSCSFKIKINSADPTYDYIRIYSIQRSTLNGPCVASIVADLSLTENLTYVDTGANNISIDPNELLYIGGKEIVAGTLEQKDGTLFLGDLHITGDDIEQPLQELLDTYYGVSNIGTETSRLDAEGYNNIDISWDYKTIDYVEDSNLLYPYKNQLIESSDKIKTFKKGETYRFGIQFRTDKGQWTRTFWIGDSTNTKAPETIPTGIIRVPYAKYTMPEALKELLGKYTSYRITMVDPSFSDRSIVAQGIVNPGVYNLYQRCNQQPYGQASWFIRPTGKNNKQFNNIQYITQTGTDFDNIDEVEIDGIFEQSYDDIQNPRHATGIRLSENYSQLGIFPNTEVEDSSLKDLASITIKYTLDQNTGLAGIYTYSSKVEIYAQWMDADGNVSEPNLEWIYDDSHHHTSIYKSYCRVKDAAYSAIFTDADFGQGFGIRTGATTENGYLGKLILRSNEFFDFGNDIKPYKGYLGTHVLTTTKVRNSVSADKSLEGITKYRNNFYLDAALPALYSPEIEDNSSIINNSNLKFRVVGYSTISSNISDYIITANNTASLYDSGAVLAKFNFSAARETLGLKAFPLWGDGIWKATFPDSNLTWKGSSESTLYMVYPWQRKGSLNGQPSDNIEDKFLNQTSSNLQHKIIANEHVCYSTNYFEDEDIWNPEAGITTVAVHQEDTNVPTIINTDDINIIYQGNYENILVPHDKYAVLDVGNHVDPLGIALNSAKEYVQSAMHTINSRLHSTTNSSLFTETYNAVHIKYNTTPHAVFRINPTSDSQVVLPGYDQNLPKGKYYIPWDANATSSIPYLASRSIRHERPADNLNYTIAADYTYTIPSSGSISAATVAYYVGAYIAAYFDNTLKLYQIVKIENTIAYCNDSGLSETAILNKFFYAKPLSYPAPDDVVKIVSTTNDYAVKSVLDSLIAKTTQDIPDNSVLIGELYRDLDKTSLYGGYTENALETNVFIPVSDVVPISQSEALCLNGDTYFQRWDCLMTYPTTEADENSVVDITSAFVETHVNIDGRCDVNRTNLIKTIARPNNFNILNPAYSQSDNLFSSNILDEKFDLSTFRNQITWTLSKNTAEDIDNWTRLSLANTLELDGDCGAVTKLKRWNNHLLAFQESGISEILYNSQTTISTTEGVPIEIANSGKVSGKQYISTSIGCYNKWSIIEAQSGLYFIDDFNKNINVFKEGIVNLSDTLGFDTWIKNNSSLSIWNPSKLDNFKAFYDSVNKDIYFINKDTCLAFNEVLNQFTSFYSYEGVPMMCNILDKFVAVKNDNLWEQHAGNYNQFFDEWKDYYMIFKVNDNPYNEKIFTNIQYIASNTNDELNQDFLAEDHTSITNSFDTLEVSNEYQYGKSDLSVLRDSPSTLKKKFRIWRANIPRDAFDNRGLNRIRNPWVDIKLYKHNFINQIPDSSMMEFHNIIVKYFM